MKVYQIVINNLVDGMMCGSPIPRGALSIVVNSKPKLVYRRSGSTIYAESNGIVNCYTCNPFDSQGFGGRTITLPMTGESTVFKTKGITQVQFHGTLCDTGEAMHETAKILGTTLHSIGIKEQNSRLDLFSSVMVTGELLAKLSKHVILGTPIMKRDSPGSF